MQNVLYTAFTCHHIHVTIRDHINIRAVSYQQESLFVYVQIIIHNFFFCNRNHFNSVVSFSICTITILYLTCTCNMIRQGKMSKSEYKQLVQILYNNDTKFLLLHYIYMYLDVSFGTYSTMFLLLQSYTVFLLLYNGSVLSYLCFQSVGIWFIFPDSPLGPTATKNFMRPNEAKHTAIELFTNNVIHSYKKGYLTTTHVLC